MPLKHNITTHDVLATQIHRLAIKNGASDLTDDEKRTKTMGIIIAILSSAHSWQIHQVIHENPSAITSSEVQDEVREAIAKRWKSITAQDVSEVANETISDSMFSRLLSSVIDPDMQGLFKSVWFDLQKYFAKACDDIEVSDRKMFATKT